MVSMPEYVENTPVFERVGQTPLVSASTYGTHDLVSHSSKKNLNTTTHNENSASTKNSCRRFPGLYLDRGATDNGSAKEQIGSQ